MVAGSTRILRILADFYWLDMEAAYFRGDMGEPRDGMRTSHGENLTAWMVAANKAVAVNTSRKGGGLSSPGSFFRLSLVSRIHTNMGVSPEANPANSRQTAAGARLKSLSHNLANNSARSH